MASIKLSALVSEIKGVLNGSILSHSRLGQSIRTRVSRQGRTSSAWTASRVQLAYVASQWRLLTAAQQVAWANMTVQYPYIDKFGDSKIPSGYQLFCTLNINLLIMNSAIDFTPYAPTAESNLGAPFFDTNAIGGLELNYTPAAVVKSIVVVYASTPCSKGVTVPPRYMRMISRFRDDTAAPYTLTSDYTRIFPDLPSGSRVFLRAEQIQDGIGQRYDTCSGFVDIP